MKFRVIIPARYESTRLPGKVLLDIAGKPMIQHVWERAQESGAQSVVIATDSEQIAESVERFGAKVCMTAATHRSGTERISEVIDNLSYEDEDIIVNLQGDEPLIPPELIRQVADNLHLYSDASMTTLCEPITIVDDLFDSNIVKVIVDKENYALYFSRAPIAWDKRQFPDKASASFSLDSIELNHYRHIGIYAYRAEFNKRYVAWPASPIEQMESLEQLRALWHGKKIHVAIACKSSYIGIDTEEDLLRVRHYLAQE